MANTFVEGGPQLGREIRPLFVIPPFYKEYVHDPKRWASLISDMTELPVEHANIALALWTRIPDRRRLGEEWATPHIYVNAAEMKRFGFPDSSFDCKAFRCWIDYQLTTNYWPPSTKRVICTYLEYKLAQQLGILDDYAACDIQHNLEHGLSEETAIRGEAYFRLKLQIRPPFNLGQIMRRAFHPR